MRFGKLPDSPGDWGHGQQQLTALWGGTSRPKLLPLQYLGPLLTASSQPTPVKKISSLFQPSRVFQALLCCWDCQLQFKLKQRVCQNRQGSALRARLCLCENTPSSSEGCDAADQLVERFADRSAQQQLSESGPTAVRRAAT